MSTKSVVTRNKTQSKTHGKDPLDALSCTSFSAKEPLIISIFCGQVAGHFPEKSH